MEKKQTTKIVKYLKHHAEDSAAYEIKVTTGASIPFTAVSEHQRLALSRVQHKSVVYKIPDEGQAQKPFDIFVLADAPAYVVLMFYKRGVKHFYTIDIDTFLDMEERYYRKSITEDMAEKYGTRHTMS